MKKIITYGTFDLLHHGHILLLRRARELGDHLTVALSTDEFNAGKGKQSFFPYEQRELILQAIRYVDEIIPEYSWEQKTEDIIRLGIDTFVIGNDWIGKFDFLKAHCNVVYLERTNNISSSHIRQHYQQTSMPT
ncbi:glycerol-3-phosphate cytidylyltransferase [Paenibacillus sp. CGMCC 1.16610]|uniref:Glycerol-3-phosphate cytidylyltransferase n=1 Tax=Paenibacillus anseongense TaxID=2682845 RepID=A0ABW9U305_9BACL|nr:MULTISPECIES: glycerol-3-phosphate cytidylyltransferase [Paenibacillus]MBA2942389.1 glycerol-3-phosphate cytidylyltransferase [Paenibacillus sp. CGMCC 1.16610]MVQ34464.1 glycerol-3-phosphate cytidylyltransferase [Paenibacillus anseongense]